METYAALAQSSDSQGDELWNQARLKAYLDAGYGPPGVGVSVCNFCDGLPAALACFDEETGERRPVEYTYPADPENPAPWYDERDPASGDFAGLLILGVTGWETANLTRQVIPRLGHGSVLGKARYNARDIVVEGLLLGRTCCSLQAGLKWLVSVLGQPCGPCGGVELDYFECCPGVGGACSPNNIAVPDQPGSPEDFDQHRRTLRNVGLTDGVQVIERMGRSCGTCSSGCSYMRVQFTLTAGDPYSYGEPNCVTEDQKINSGEVMKCIEWNTSCEDIDPCVLVPCPAGDPFCPVAPTPPGLPAIVSCSCAPLQSNGSCTYIEDLELPDFQESVPIITIKSGSAPLRNIVVQFYENPLGLPADMLSDCNSCSSFVISYLEADSTFVVDGRDRRFWVTCPGRSASDGSRLVTGLDNQPFTWPVLYCAGGYTLCVTANSTDLADDSTYSLCLVPRSAA